MEFSPLNSGTIIKRVWIIKKSITITDKNFNLLGLFQYLFLFRSNEFEKFEMERPIVNIFKIKKEYKSNFKHWALLLELSNKTYTNIQFGRNGFALKEFSQTDEEGRNIINAILNTWGEQEHPVSFCYLGEANYE